MNHDKLRSRVAAEACDAGLVGGPEERRVTTSVRRTAAMLLLGGYAAVTIRALTASVDGANIGGALLVMVGFVLVPILVVLAVRG